MNDKGKKIKVACVGDSITFGEGIENRTQNAYPRVLAEFLGSEYMVKNFGVPGTTMLKKGDSPYWTQFICKRAFKFNPDIVVIKLGTNDSRAENWRLKEEFAIDYKDMIDKFKTLESNPKVFVCLPSPAYGSTFDIDKEIISSEILPLVTEIAEQNNCQLIDLHTPLVDKEHLFPDKLHPNSEGAKILAENVYKSIVKIID